MDSGNYEIISKFQMDLDYQGIIHLEGYLNKILLFSGNVLKLFNINTGQIIYDFTNC